MGRKLLLYFPIVILLWLLLPLQQLRAQSCAIKITAASAANSFPLAAKGFTTTLVTDANDAEVVQIAANALKSDIEQVTGMQSKVANNVTSSPYAVIIGTLGKSKLVDQLASAHKIAAGQVKGKWETFGIAVVDHPFKNTKKTLVIFGSDRRGTAYGVFELSRMIGVSPLVWWADVTPPKKAALYVTPGKAVFGPPSVKYRGIFLNDEDWGLQPWAAKNMDPEVKDIGPHTYQRIFELLLRLKANYIWPAMHPCTKAFWYYPENPKLANKYAIVLGASHCEPMLRNNVFEWAENFKNEYGTTPGEWRYDVNPDQINKYWNDRVEQSKNMDAVYTVGMRGIHDGSMPGPKSRTEKVKLLDQVIQNQRQMLTKDLNKPADQIPQIFCPYKEVLDLYQSGLHLPDDVTITWADDNYGYIRQLSDPEEQKRKGGSGIYYHLSYWGAPQDYLWLSSNSPSLISYELSKAYLTGADKLWIINVGDIKPAEMEIQFAMDLAWNIKQWTPDQAYRYPRAWAAATFGTQYAEDISRIKLKYYELAASGKPEHINAITYTDEEIEKRLKDYQALAAETEVLYNRIPANLKDAFFGLIYYPVEGSKLMNEKIFYADKSLKLAKQGNQEALTYAAKAQLAYNKIQELTTQYNTQVAGGKWNGIMSSHPRDREVFKMPKVATSDMIATTPVKVTDSAKQVTIIPAADFITKHTSAQMPLQIINGLGTGGKGVTVWPFNVKQFTDGNIQDAPYVEYTVNFKQGQNHIGVRCFPDFKLYNGLSLRYAISVDGEKPQWVNIATRAETKDWSINVLRGYALGETTYNASKSGTKTVKIYFPNPGLVVNALTVTQP